MYVMMYTDNKKSESRCSIPSFVEIGQPFPENILSVLTINGYGGHLNHLNWIIYTLSFSFPKKFPDRNLVLIGQAGSEIIFFFTSICTWTFKLHKTLNIVVVVHKQFF